MAKKDAVSPVVMAAAKKAKETPRTKKSRRRHEMELERKNLSILKKPIRTLYYFNRMLLRLLISGVRTTYQRKYFFHVVGGCLLGYCALKLAGRATALEQALLFTMWWVSLGILSSVGLGSGMHTGLLFLWPHVFRCVAAAESCGNTDFESLSDMWGTKGGGAFTCTDPKPGSSVSFLDVWRKVAPECILWGLGTAIGEIPPYALCYSASQAGKRNEDFEEAFVVSEGSHLNRYLGSWLEWMLGLVQKHGLLAVVLLSSWPNAAFDMCGMACGHFLMPFWTFFLGLVVGKAFIKVNLQGLFILQIFRRESRDLIIDYLRTSLAVPIPFLDSAKLGDVVSDSIVRHVGQIQNGPAQSAGKGEGLAEAFRNSLLSVPDFLRFLWDVMPSPMSLVMTLFVIGFVVSCVEQLARQYKAEEDEQKLDAEMKHD